jgi:signal peptidase I
MFENIHVGMGRGMTLVQETSRRSRRWGKTLLIVAAVVLAIAVLFRSLLFQPFNIPARSMAPTLLEGDHLFVSKFTYGYTHYSFPFSPKLFSGRIFGSEPGRGDVVVFRSPKDDSADYLKRVVGLPGDRIQISGGQLHINGVAVVRERLPDLVGEDPCGNGPNAGPVRRWRETLPNHLSYETLDCIDSGRYDDTSVYTVPAGHFFMLGDNRDNSIDSRVSAIGYIPLENIIGRAGPIFYSLSTTGTVRTERMGSHVD